MELLQGVLNRLNVERLTWKIQVDTYQRELERYGFDYIETTETIFYEDSKVLLKLLNENFFVRPNGIACYIMSELSRNSR